MGKQVFYRTHLGKINQLLETDYTFPGIDNVHFDVLCNSTGREEDYSPDWPQTRHDYIRNAIAMASYYRRQGQIVSSEGKADIMAAHMHWGSFRNPIVPNYDQDFLPPDKGGFQPAPDLRPIPLWHLVFHDVMFHSSWEHYTYNDGNSKGSGRPRISYLHDLLYGDLPSVFPMGRIYRFTKFPAIEYYSIDFQAPIVQESLRLAKKAAAFHRQVGLSKMLSHTFLDKSGLVQQTVFETGQRVTVNFSGAKIQVDGRRPIPSESCRIED